MNTGYTPWLPAWIPDWALYVLASMFLLAALGAVLRVFFGDRRRPQRSCPKCWYDMSRTTGLRCPECGNIAGSLRQLQRPRVHRLRWTLAAVILLAFAAGSASLPTVRTGGWLALVPTRVLPWLLVFDGPQQHTIGRALFSRIGSQAERLFGLPGKSDEQQLARVILRLARGVPGARPPSDAWANTFGWTLEPVVELAERGFEDQNIDNSSRTPEARAALREARDALLALPYSAGVMLPRSAWPRDRELLLQLPVRAWWPSAYPMFTLTSYSINGGPWSQPRRNFGIGSTGFTPGPEAPSPLRVDVKVEVFRSAPGTAEPVLIGTEHRGLALRLTESTEQAMTALRDPRLDALLAKSPAVFRNATLSYDPAAAAAAAGGFAGVALALNLELRRDGKPIMSQSFYAIVGAPPRTWSGRFYPVTETYVREPAEAELLRRAAAELDGTIISSVPAAKSTPPSTWTLRITPQRLLPYTIMDATMYWDGTLEIPVIVRP